MPATPYWGQLPNPKSAATTKARRLSDDLGSTTPDRRQSLDGAAAQQRQNRISVQTTYTDAPTESTLSPFASPTRSSFQGQGLAPRPPSLPYGADQYPPELYENRRRRRSHSQEQDYEYADAALPAAPEVPRAPPSSYRHPYGNGGGPPLAYPPTGGPPRTARRSDGPLTLSTMDPEYLPGANRQSSAPNPGQPRNNFDAGAGPPATAAAPPADGSSPTAARSATARDAANGRRLSGGEPPRQQRRFPLGDQPGRRKFTNDRSPLQRLELTLDSITKEEKRARVEAAEQAARERAAAAAAQERAAAAPQADKGPPPQQVRFSDGSPSAAVAQGQRSRATSGAASSTPVTPAAQKARVPHIPGDDGSKHTPNATKSSPQAQVPESRIPRPSINLASGIPQRNLSFRERAAKNDVKLPSGLEGDSPAAASPVTPASGFSLTRSGSNKLQKTSPKDPWLNKKMEAEKYITGARGASAAGAPAVGGAPLRTGAPDQPQLASTTGNRPPIPGVEVGPSAAVAQLTKSPSQSKADRLLGRTPPQNQSKAERLLGISPPQRAQTAPNQGLGAPAAALAVGAAGAAGATAVAAATAGHHHQARRETRSDSDSDDGEHRHVSDLVYRGRENLKPGQGIYQPPTYLDEWKNATTGTLSGALLELDDEPPNPVERDSAWWERRPSTSSRRGSISSRPRNAEAFVGEYDDANGPTKFRPPLYLKCGPLLRFCGIRKERARSPQNGGVSDREIWRGSVMIVTQDAASTYDIAPTLRLFAQPIELLPPPPTEIGDEEALAPEHVDPIAGHPKLGRKGETLYVRPVDHLEEATDLSRDETDSGLFEKTRSPPDTPLAKGVTDPPGSFAARIKRVDEADGEKLGKHKNIRGFRLHAERGCTFWRFNIEVELRPKQQRIAYRINRGPATGFWVPAKGTGMNIMFHSCNGFSLGATPDEFSGPDPMWRDVLNAHQSRPFHVMIGGGDQVYNDAVTRQTEIFKDWLTIKNPLQKHNAPLTPEMQDELETFYLDRYSMWFSQGLFGMANSQIPMVNMYDDHDIIDGFGSYPHHFMNSPVFSGLGNIAFKYYMLFQHQSVMGETEESEPSWILGSRPGPYINELSRSLFMSLGSGVALLAVDARTERTRNEVLREDTWKKIMDRCYDEMEKGKPQHLLVLLGVPIAYPRLVWLENILTSRLMDPIKALGKVGMLGNFLNKFDGGVEVLDDLDDHWTAKCHKHERRIVIEDLQDLAADQSVRVTILSGDVHLAAVGQFYSNPKLGLAKHKDFRYMPNVISSAIANTPPPDLMADILNKRNKVHHFDKETDEDMIPMFAHGVDGKNRNNKRLLPHRNWCSIREYTPGNTPPPSPPPSEFDDSPLGSPPGGSLSGPRGLLRRLSKSSRRTPSVRVADGGGVQPDSSRPPLSGAGIFRSFSRSHRTNEDLHQGQKHPSPGILTRTLSLGRGEGRLGGLFRRTNSSGGPRSPDDGGINGHWGDTDDDEDDYDEDDLTPPPPRPPKIGLRGGAGSPGGHDEYEEGDESYFSVRVPKRAQTLGAAERRPSQDAAAGARGEKFVPRPLYRAPTGLSVKQLKRGRDLEVNPEGGLEVCLNVEVNQRDPTGITVPYRLLVPRLWYEDDDDDQSAVRPQATQEPQGIKRWFSLKRGLSLSGGKGRPAPLQDAPANVAVATG